MLLTFWLLVLLLFYNNGYIVAITLWSWLLYVDIIYNIYVYIIQLYYYYILIKKPKKAFSYVLSSFIASISQSSSLLLLLRLELNFTMMCVCIAVILNFISRHFLFPSLFSSSSSKHEAVNHHHNIIIIVAVVVVPFLFYSRVNSQVIHPSIHHCNTLWKS
jgi:hypothetical protein